jgi:predicted TIM-barrel fold metal-dependent hydrolase
VIGDAFVVDAVVHGYNIAPENRIGGRYADGAAAALAGAHTAWAPAPEWALPPGFMESTATSAELLGAALFAESQTDVCVYHDTPHWGLYRDGGSPLSVGARMQELWPGRVALYGGVSPWEDDPIGRIDELVERHGVVGLKLYPLDLVNGELRSLSMGDEELLYPLLEHARKRGIRMIAVHKAVPYGPVPLAPFRMDDLDYVLDAFPDLIFEVVHGGLAFVDETCAQLVRFPNIAVNLEGTTGLLTVAPRRFMEALGKMLASGGASRIFWSTGCSLVHPRPLIEAFWAAEMPPDLVEGYGYPVLTDELKRAVLGANFLAISGITFAPDATPVHELAAPWTGEQT